MMNNGLQPELISPITLGSQASILVVDDTVENINLLSTMLRERGYKVRGVINGEMALMGVQAAPPDLILLDIMMPGIDGYEVCQRLKHNPLTAAIPVIFLSATDDVLDKVKAFSAGGADFITKPFQVEEVLARIKNQLAIQAAKAEISLLNAELEQRVKQRTAQLEREVAERQKAQERLLYLALYDSLTTLPNRTWLIRKLKQTLAIAKQQQNYQFAILCLDCDNFKAVNDSLGHSVGDRLLVAMSERLQACLRPADIIVRLGGDEFAILLAGIKNENDAIATAERIHRELTLPFPLKQQEVFVNASIGIVLGRPDYRQPETLLRDADTAMYRAKELGQARYQIFNASMHSQAQRRLQAETDLRLAVERQEFQVYYQPIMALDTGSIAGFEALIRWNHPQRGLVSPEEFISLAEQTGLIIPIGLFVMQKACHQLQEWQAQGLCDAAMKMSINLSPKQFIQPDLIEQTDRILAHTRLAGRSLKLEITESALMCNSDRTTEVFTQLKARGIELIIDDFGTGFSSLSYLHRFPVDGLKIDRSFISNLDEQNKNHKIVQAITTLAQQLELSVVAEGVETSAQKSQLTALQCQFAQGYFYAKPLETSLAKTFLARAKLRSCGKNDCLG
ncbi:MAG: EAL domain-containing protein [Cyanophyceae cyanobacterium]